MDNPLKNCTLENQMGCRKLTYHTEGSLEKNPKSFLRVLGKKGYSQKKRLNYYPFGMEMPGRKFSSSDYKYGFNGMEKDDELKGSGNSYDFGARLYDPRLGRWLAVDAMANVYPFYSPFVYAANSPVTFIDPDGNKIRIYYVDKHNERQSVVLKSVSDLEVYKNHENNFVRAVISDLAEGENNWPEGPVKQAINLQKKTAEIWVADPTTRDDGTEAYNAGFDGKKSIHFNP